MRIESTNVFVGPNLFALFPVIRHVLDLGELEHWPTGRLGEDFMGPLLELLPGLHEHGCSYKEPGGFVRRLREELRVNTTCGASNVSFGLPNRNGINSAFLTMAISAGMTSAITSPLHAEEIHRSRMMGPLHTHFF